MRQRPERKFWGEDLVDVKRIAIEFEEVGWRV